MSTCPTTSASCFFSRMVYVPSTVERISVFVSLSGITTGSRMSSPDISSTVPGRLVPLPHSLHPLQVNGEAAYVPHGLIHGALLHVLQHLDPPARRRGLDLG